MKAGVRFLGQAELRQVKKYLDGKVHTGVSEVSSQVQDGQDATSNDST
jgi:hypothetical protein